MQSRDFVYWLQGLFELAEPLTLNKKQTELIKNHLSMVFVHEIDPSMGDKEHQGKLNAVHLGQKKPHCSQQDLSISITNTSISKEKTVPPQLPSIPAVLVQESLVAQQPSLTVKPEKLIYRC